MRSLDFLLQLINIGAFFALAQFLLDRLDLFVQVILALAFFHLAPDAPADAFFHLQNIQLRFQQAQQMFETLAHIKNFQHFLFLFQLERQVRGDGIRQPPGIVYASQRGQDFRRNLLVEFDVLVELVDQRTAHRFGLMAETVIQRNRFDIRVKMRLLIQHAQNFGALRPLHQHLDRTVRQFEHLQDVGNAADAIQIVHGRLILGGSFLCHQHDALARLHGRLQRLDGFRAPNKQGNHHMREHHHIAQRQ